MKKIATIGISIILLAVCKKDIEAMHRDTGGGGATRNGNMCCGHNTCYNC